MAPESPPGTATRLIAHQILRQVRAGQPFDRALERAASPLSDPDRRFVHEISAGVLRQQDVLDDLLAPLAKHGWPRVPDDLKDILRLGAYQLRHLDRVPPHAAVATSVTVARELAGDKSAGFVNAVLRRVAAESPTAQGSPDFHRSLARRFSHPGWLVDRWLDHFGLDDTRRLLEWNNRRPAIVLQAARQPLSVIQATLEAAGIQVTGVDHGMGLMVEGIRPPALPGFPEGDFVVQDPAQACVVRFAGCPANGTVLDVCAAPGGKTVALSRTARLVVAGDKRKKRLARLLQNIDRAGQGPVAVVVADAASPPVAGLDCVLVDAPCSGTGTFARHPDARHRLKPEDIARLAASQRAILDGAAAAVRPGGLLVYATCSLEPEENEHQVDRFLTTHADFRREPADGIPPEMTSPVGDLMLLPQRHGTDGAYAARLRRSQS